MSSAEDQMRQRAHTVAARFGPVEAIHSGTGTRVRNYEGLAAPLEPEE